MQVIGHKAVRNYCELFLRCTSLNLRQHEIHALARNEYALTRMGAKSEGITIEPEVVECLQVARSCGEHGATGARHVPREVRLEPQHVRLKPDTTYVMLGPAKAGHYVRHARSG